MSKRNNISLIISNILNQKRYSHCRLCLKDIEKTYVRMDDAVALYPKNGEYQTLNSLLIKLLGDEVSCNN